MQNKKTIEKSFEKDKKTNKTFSQTFQEEKEREFKLAELEMKKGTLKFYRGKKFYNGILRTMSINQIIQTKWKNL